MTVGVRNAQECCVRRQAESHKVYNVGSKRFIFEVHRKAAINLPIIISLFRLVNENEVKQWKEQAEKMRKGAYAFPVSLQIMLVQ